MAEQADTTRPHYLAIFLSYIGGGGAERVMLNLAASLSEDNSCKVDLILGSTEGPHLNKIPKGVVELVTLNSSGFLPTTIALAKYLKQRKPDAILSALHYANEISILARKISGVDSALIVTEHNTMSKYLKASKGMKKRLIPVLTKFLYPHADQVVAVSKGVADDLVNTTGLPSKHINVIYNPVITPDIPLKSGQAIDHPWFLQKEIPVILGVGKLEEQKDFPTLIKAFAEVRKIREARLVILGWGPDRPQIELLVHQLDLDKDVALLGYVENPFPYMAKATLFVLSSAWEGFGNVIVEAMSVGTPVVATDCPSGPSEILDGGRYGSLVRVGNYRALASSILDALDGNVKLVDPEWLDQFSLQSITNRYYDLLELNCSLQR